MVHTSAKTATTIIGMAMLCLMALSGGACVHQPSEHQSAAEPFDAANPVDASHVTKPGVPLDVVWAVDAAQPFGSGTATAVLTVSARGNLEEAVLTLEPSSGLRLVGPARIRLGALAAGDTRRIEVPLVLGDRGRAELRAVVAAEGGAGDVAVSVSRADVLYVLLGPARSFAARGSFIVAQQDSLRHALAAGRMTPEDFEAAMQQLGRGTGEVTTTRSEKKTSSAVFTLSGTIKYQDRNGTLRPVRFAPIEVWDDDFGFDDLLATTTTDANGTYSVPVPEDASDAPDLYINVLARSDEFYVVTPGDQGDPSSTYSVATDDAVEANVET
ncbi:MAG: hypothetical protein AAFN13_06570, partial [Bacteroidota bacterium]